jgi:hypothetical protein
VEREAVGPAAGAEGQTYLGVGLLEGGGVAARARADADGGTDVGAEGVASTTASNRAGSAEGQGGLVPRRPPAPLGTGEALLDHRMAQRGATRTPGTPTSRSWAHGPNKTADAAMSVIPDRDPVRDASERCRKGRRSRC